MNMLQGASYRTQSSLNTVETFDIQQYPNTLLNNLSSIIKYDSRGSNSEKLETIKAILEVINREQPLVYRFLSDRSFQSKWNGQNPDECQKIIEEAKKRFGCIQTPPTEAGEISQNAQDFEWYIFAVDQTRLINTIKQSLSEYIEEIGGSNLSQPEAIKVLLSISNALIAMNLSESEQKNLMIECEKIIPVERDKRYKVIKNAITKTGELDYFSILQIILKENLNCFTGNNLTDNEILNCSFALKMNENLCNKISTELRIEYKSSLELIESQEELVIKMENLKNEKEKIKENIKKEEEIKLELEKSIEKIIQEIEGLTKEKPGLNILFKQFQEKNNEIKELTSSLRKKEKELEKIKNEIIENEEEKTRLRQELQQLQAEDTGQLESVNQLLEELIPEVNDSLSNLNKQVDAINNPSRRARMMSRLGNGRFILIGAGAGAAAGLTGGGIVGGVGGAALGATVSLPAGPAAPLVAPLAMGVFGMAGSGTGALVGCAVGAAVGGVAGGAVTLGVTGTEFVNRYSRNNRNLLNNQQQPVPAA